MTACKRIEVSAGIKIGDAIRQTKEKAIMENTSFIFDFNGIDVFVNSSTNIDVCLNEWWNTKQKRENKTTRFKAIIESPEALAKFMVDNNGLFVNENKIVEYLNEEI